MTIPHRPLGVIDISEELGSDGPLGLRDETVMQLAGIPEYQTPVVLDIPTPISTGPYGPVCVIRDRDGIDHPIMGTGPIEDTDIIVTREISVSHGGEDVRIQVTGADVVAVVEWGDPSGWDQPVHGISFKGCVNLVSVPDTLPEWATDCREMFYGCSTFNDPVVVGWDTSRVKDMAYMYHGAVVFNQPIGTWVVHSVLYMEYMFFVATAFNQDLSGWAVGQFQAQPDGFDQGASSYTLERPRWSEVDEMGDIKSSIQVVDLEGKSGKDGDIIYEGILTIGSSTIYGSTSVGYGLNLMGDLTPATTISGTPIDYIHVVLTAGVFNIVGSTIRLNLSTLSSPAPIITSVEVYDLNGTLLAMQDLTTWAVSHDPGATYNLNITKADYTGLFGGRTSGQVRVIMRGKE